MPQILTSIKYVRMPPDMRQQEREIMVINYSEFPRIKCNINGASKIYHLPFDQQYDRTEIKNAGEFYAWTVKEAESKGFRRAMRHQLY